MEVLLVGVFVFKKCWFVSILALVCKMFGLKFEF